MLIVIIGWVFFRIEDFSDAVHYTGKLFGVGTSGQLKFNYFLNNENLVILIISLLISVRFFLFNDPISDKIRAFIQKMTFVRQTVLLVLFLYAVILLNSGSYNPFIYFQF